MTLITVSDEQARLIAGASSPIVFVDVRGRELGKLEPSQPTNQAPYDLTDEELAELKRRASIPGPGKTTQEILTRLQSLAPIEGS